METEEVTKTAEEMLRELHSEIARHFLSLLDRRNNMKGSSYKVSCVSPSQYGTNPKDKPVGRFSEGVEVVNAPISFLEDDTPNLFYGHKVSECTYLSTEYGA